MVVAPYVEGPYVEGHYVEGHYVEGHYVEGHYVEGHYVEGHYVEGQGEIHLSSHCPMGCAAFEGWDMDQQQLEENIIEDPIEGDNYAVLGDWLAERGDPWGELIQTQLQLDRPDLDSSARTQLAERESEILQQHEERLFGPLAPHLKPITAEDINDWNMKSRPEVKCQWDRGVIASLTTDCLTVPLAQAMADAEQLKFLQSLHVISTAYYLGMQESGDQATPRRVKPPASYRGYDEWLELLGSPLLRCLRRFQMGDRDGEPPEYGWSDNNTYAPGIDRLIAEMTNIEELHLLCKEYDAGSLFSLPNLGSLRVLRMAALGDPNANEVSFEIPLTKLAENPTLKNLEVLKLHPHFSDHRCFVPLSQVAAIFHSPNLPKLRQLQLRMSTMGDKGVRELVESGILKRLTQLDLRHGCITDRGAERLAKCHDARNLRRLDLSRNAVTDAGRETLQKALKDTAVVVRDPMSHTEIEDRQYLREGDFE